MSLSNDEIIKWQKRAKACACAKGFPDLAEDFASEIFISFIQNPDRGATVEQLFIDFLRKERGNVHTKDGRAKVAARNSQMSIDDTDQYGQPVVETLQVEISEEPCGESNGDGGNYEYLFKGRNACIYKLHFEEEFLQREIAEILSINTATVWRRMKKKINPAIERHAIFQSGRERMEWDERFLKFTIHWLSL